MSAGNKESVNILYRIQCPSLERLCGLRVNVPVGRYPLPQWHIIVCRELIFTEKDIVATPLLSKDQTFVVVMEQSLYKTGRIQQRLKTKALQFDKPFPVTVADFSSCLRYTIMARMSGRWNQVGDLLVEGEDFLLSRQRKDALKLNLNVCQSQSFLSVTPHAVTLPPSMLLDFGISAQVVTKFLENRPNGIIEEQSIVSKWCHVLPSMKKGQIINITHKIPDDCPFKTYREIKTYWRATYGYYLPEKEESVFYCQVYFKLIGETLFTYPNCCIRAQEPVIFRRQNQVQEMKFISDLASKMPNVCGLPLIVHQPPNCTTPALNNAATLQNHGSAANLVQSKSIQEKHLLDSNLCMATTDLHSGGSLQVKNPVVDDCSSPNEVFKKNSETTDEQIPDKSQTDFTLSITKESVLSTNDFGTNYLNRPIKNFQNGVSFKKVCDEEPLKPRKEANQKIVPVFTSKFRQVVTKPSSNLKQVNIEHDGKASENVKPRTVFGDGRALTTEYKIGNLQESGNTSYRPAPSFRAKTTNPPLVCSQTNRLQDSEGHVAPGTAVDAGRLHQTNVSVAERKNILPDFTNKLTVNSMSSLSKCFETSEKEVIKQDSLAPFSQKKFTGKVETSASLQSCSENGLAVILETKPLTNLTIKRKTADRKGAEETKRPRAKPKVQEGADVEMLLRHNQAKLNRETLINWLKQKGVACKAKDKKEELVEKALRIIAVKSSES